MRLTGLLAVTAALAAAAPASASIRDIVDIAPLYTTRSDTYGDNFYTIDPAQRDLSMSCCGFHSPSIAAFVPRYAGNGHPDQPYAFARLFKGAPQLDHFYTTNQSERAQAEAWGWQYEGNEGALYSTARSGSVPLYRLNLWNHATNEGQHFYTTSNATMQSYQNAGWTLDGIAGYAFAYRLPHANEHASHRVFGSQLYLIAPAVSDTAGTSFAHGCGGQAKVTLDGVNIGTFANFSYGQFPGTFERHCYMATWHGIPFNSGSHTIRIEFSGYAARLEGLQGTNLAYDFWKVIVPSTYSTTFSVNSAAEESPKDALIHDDASLEIIRKIEEMPAVSGVK